MPNNLFTVLPPFSVVDEWPLKRGTLFFSRSSCEKGKKKKSEKKKIRRKKIARALAPVLSLLLYARFPVGTQLMPYFNRFNRCRIFVGEGVVCTFRDTRSYLPFLWFWWGQNHIQFFNLFFLPFTVITNVSFFIDHLHIAIFLNATRKSSSCIAKCAITRSRC